MLRIIIITLMTLISTLTFNTYAIDVYGSSSAIYSNDEWFFDDVEGDGYDTTPDAPGIVYGPIEDGYIALVLMGVAYAFYKKRKIKNTHVA
ncbi:MAG: hypothetical protein ACRC6R_01805 [Bacteroidales bacterium]